MKDKLTLILGETQVTDGIVGLVQLRHYFKNHGWFNSRYHKVPQTTTGHPLPWYTYAAISFIGERLSKTLNVFEFGIGNSTRWYADKVGHVSGCEHNQLWYQKVLNDLPQNVDIICRDITTDKYAKAVKESGKLYDLIAIDGRNRVECVKESIDCLNKTGVIIFDNSERSKYQAAYDLLNLKGFRRLDFKGLGPINTEEWSTSVFYRSNNILGI